jgi:hypothetical protein
MNSGATTITTRRKIGAVGLFGFEEVENPSDRNG